MESNSFRSLFAERSLEATGFETIAERKTSGLIIIVASP
jgi:hypothetical protein